MGQLFSCTRAGPEQADAPTRRPRLLQVEPPSYDDVVQEGRRSIRIPRVHEEKYPRVQPGEDQEPLIVIDEKEPAIFDCSASLASSSVVSIPSTRIGTVTSESTGRTVNRDSTCSSYAGSTLLPSYHSRRSLSPAPTLPIGSGHGHPVMDDDWLGNLQQRAYESRK